MVCFLFALARIAVAMIALDGKEDRSVALSAVALFVFMLLYLLPDSFMFDRAVVSPNKSMKLKNCFGLTVGTIPSTIPRRHEMRAIDHTFVGGGGYRRFKNYEIQVFTADETYPSIPCGRQEIEAALHDLADANDDGPVLEEKIVPPESALWKLQSQAVFALRVLGIGEITRRITLFSGENGGKSRGDPRDDTRMRESASRMAFESAR
ncbi:MAG: hypothetical protein HYX75_02050 [Acidobacteria bacterium]|nr:hypothetical protein [Acidobacteriota bacterium]